MSLDHKRVCLDEVSPNENKIVQSLAVQRQPGWHDYTRFVGRKQAVLAMKEDAWRCYGLPQAAIEHFQSVRQINIVGVKERNILAGCEIDSDVSAMRDATIDRIPVVFNAVVAELLADIFEGLVRTVVYDD